MGKTKNAPSAKAELRVDPIALYGDLFASAEQRALAFEPPSAGAEPGGVPADEATRIKAWAAKNKSVLNAKAGGDDLELAILGVIGGWWEGISARAVRSVLNDHKDAKSIRVLIDSPGGDYFDGVAIMNLLRRHKARVTVEIIGEATSAGSVIAMAGDRIEMHVGTMMMIHRAWTWAVGNGSEIRTTAEMLDKVDEGLLAVYKARTSASEADIKKWVDATTWMTSADAVERGFADAELAALPEKSEPDATEHTDAEDCKCTTCCPTPDASGGAAPSAAVVADPAVVEQTVASIESRAAAMRPANSRHAATQTTPSPEGPDPNPTNLGKEQQTMTVPKNEPENHNVTPAVIRAMGLLPGATETDVMARITTLRELELQSLAITGVQDTAQLVGAIRGLKAKADNADAVSAELLQVKSERDAQNFEALIMKGTSHPVKLSTASAKFYQDKFADAQKQDAELKDGAGRAEAVVKDLTGFLASAPTIIAPKATPPENKRGSSKSPSTPGALMTHEGRTFAEMKPSEQARLSKEEPELHKAMRDEWVAAGRPAAPAKSA